eukprot:265888-Pyramimonas_sp.AAC.1
MRTFVSRELREGPELSRGVGSLALVVVSARLRGSRRASEATARRLLNICRSGVSPASGFGVG